MGVSQIARSMHNIPEGSAAYAVFPASEDSMAHYHDFENVRSKIERETLRLAGTPAR